MSHSQPRIIGIDWSGKRTGAKKAIWTAEAADGRLRELRNGRTRDEVVDYLIDEAHRDPDLIVGLDFAFSFPEWFVRERSCDGGPGVWDLVRHKGEDWLAACDPPFWGRPGRKRPDLREHFRATEVEMRAQNATKAKSVFQIGGAGAVGTGSIRGMPVLQRLANAGFHIWPFHPVGSPLVVEIYPRVLTGPVIKSKPSARRSYVERHFKKHRVVTKQQLDDITDSEDAFDAAVSALVMMRYADNLIDLPPAGSPRELLEGRIWTPEVGE